MSSVNWNYCICNLANLILFNHTVTCNMELILCYCSQFLPLAWNLFSGILLSFYCWFCLWVGIFEIHLPNSCLVLISISTLLFFTTPCVITFHFSPIVDVFCFFLKQLLKWSIKIWCHTSILVPPPWELKHDAWSSQHHTYVFWSYINYIGFFCIKAFWGTGAVLFDLV